MATLRANLPHQIISDQVVIIQKGVLVAKNLPSDEYGNPMHRFAEVFRGLLKNRKPFWTLSFRINKPDQIHKNQSKA